jgi:high frequency lysogenization protein
MSLNTFTNQTIALAGIAQATELVNQLATQGTADPVAFKSSIGSLLKIDSDSVTDVFGGLAGIKLGLEQFHEQISGAVTHSEQARYAASLVFLEQQLSEQPKMLKTIQIGIEKAQAQAEYFDVLHENVIANLGDLYYNTISTLQPRIMVNGDELYLSRPDTVNKIRALLLAGIRATLLWRQCGGARWKFLFYRKKLQNEAKFLLSQV